MSWLKRLLGGEKSENPRYANLHKGPHWQITKARDFELFFRHLADLVPQDSILYLEDTAGRDVRERLERMKLNPGFEVRAGTLWPKPTKYHVPITKENLLELSELAKFHAEPEIAMHMVVYCGSAVLLEWYDAGDDPIAISKGIPEHSVRKFCDRLGAKCQDSAGY